MNTTGLGETDRGQPSLSAATRRYLIELVVAGAAFGAVLLFRFFMPVDWVNDVTQHPIGRDFLNVWGAPRIAAEHGAAVLADLLRYPGLLTEQFGHPLERFFNWSYPPHALLLLWPFSILSHPAALAVWTIAGLAAYAAAVGQGLPERDRTFGAMIAIASPATIWCVFTGQNGLLLGAGLLFALLSIEKRPILAGLLFGMLTIKPQLGLLIPIALIAIGAWRTILTAAATAAALVLVSLAVWGIEPWRLWLTVTSGYQVALIEDITNFHRYMMVSIAASAFILDAPKVLAFALQGVGAAVAVAAVWICFRRTRDQSTRALVLLLSGTLATPYAFNYDLTALTGATLWLISARREAPAFERRTLGLVLLLPVAIVPLHMVQLPIAPAVLICALGLVMRPLIVAGRPQPALVAA